MKDKKEAEEVLDYTFLEIKKWVASLEKGEVGAKLSLEELRERISRPLSDEGTSALKTIEHIVHSAQGGVARNVGGRFFAWVIGGSVPSSLASDLMVSAWDQNAALYSTSPASAVFEEVAGNWMIELLDLPKGSSFAFTTGCQMAHFTGLAAARYRVLKDLDWNINNKGLFGAPKIKLITSEYRHDSVDRATRYLGIGSEALVAVKVDDSGRVRLDHFKKELEYDGPKIVVLDAADLNIAAFDSFRELIPLAKEKGAWVHIDGAFGLFARASRAKKHLTEGLELADSWATDGHKWLNVPFDCGMAIVRDTEAHRQSMTISASYLTPKKEARDQIDWNPEWSRRARAIPVYGALMELGKKGVEELIDRCCENCALLIHEVSKIEGVEVLWKPTLNQALFRVLSSKEKAGDIDHDKKTMKVLERVNQSGEAFFSPTQWKGKSVFRVSVVNWQTTKEDIHRAAESIRKAVLELTHISHKV